jgi:membrane protease subunit HflK
MRALAMAGGKTPWGGKGKPKADPGDPAQDQTEPTQAQPEPDAPETEKANEPRNPWHSDADEAAGRRSPRIDDILRQRRTGSGGGGGFPNFPGAIGARGLIPWLAAGGAVLLALAGSVQMLEPGQQGIVTTLGRYNRTISEGFNLTLPWPLEVVRVRGSGGSMVTTLPGTEGETALLTRDGELIEVTADLRWRISDPRAFTAAFADPDAAIARLAQAELRAGVAELPFDDLWNGSRQKEAEDRIADRIDRALGAMRAGVRVEGFAITRASPPASLSASFDKVLAERQKAAKLREDSEEWAQDLIRDTQSEASAFNRVYEQYRLAPDVVRSRMYYQTMERILKNNKRVVIGGVAADGQTQPEVN